MLYVAVATAVLIAAIASIFAGGCAVNVEVAVLAACLAGLAVVVAVVVVVAPVIVFLLLIDGGVGWSLVRCSVSITW